MNNTFNISRFGKYFLSDLRKGFDNFALSLLVIAMGGLICYVIVRLVGVLTDSVWSGMGYSVRTAVLMLFNTVLIFTSGSKLYGYLTKKHEGSFFSLLPVSAFEKTLSMVLISGVIAPLCFFGLYFCADALICLIDPLCGEPLLKGDMFSRLLEFSAEDTELVKAVGITPFWSFVQTMFNVLIFVLGAICFKKHKVAKTILTVILITSVAGMLLSWMDFDLEVVEPIGDGLGVLRNVLNGAKAFEVVCILGLMTAIFFRIKTIKY